MVERFSGGRASGTLGIALAATLFAAACGGGAPAASPEPTPTVTTLAPTLPPETISTLPPISGVPPAESAPAAAAPPAASPEAPAAQPSGAPSPSAEDEARKKQEDQLRADLAAAKARADTLAAGAATECPDLKPGEQRHPGAVGRCARLKAEAAQAAEEYEALKKDARAAGIAVQ